MEITLNEVKEAINNCMFSLMTFFDGRRDNALIVFNNTTVAGRAIKLERENDVVTIKITDMDVVKTEKILERELNQKEINSPFLIRCEIYKNIIIKEIATLIFDANFNKIFDSPEIRKEMEKEFEGKAIDDILISGDMVKLSKVLWNVYITSEVGNKLKVEL